MSITEHKFCTTPRHKTAYLSSGNAEDPLVIFVHGWPELGLSWRQQLPFVAGLGYFAVAPDLRGYGHSSIYQQHADYALEPVVHDMLELLDSFGRDQAIWVGHDWGAPVVWSLARHHPERCRAVANLCVPYATLELGWDGLLPYINRNLYPQDIYPAGQWEYQLFYAEQFERATAYFDADPARLLKLLFRSGNASGRGQVSGTARTRLDDGWFGGGDMPDLPRDENVISEADLQTYAAHLSQNSFFGPDSYYMNHDANAQYSSRVDSDDLTMPVLFLHARYDYTCETLDCSAAEPMRGKCANLTEGIVDSGHWMAQEQPDAVNSYLEKWLAEL